MPENRRSLLLLVLLSGLIISVCMGLRQSLGLFMRPMTVDLGISAATVSREWTMARAWLKRALNDER